MKPKITPLERATCELRLSVPGRLKTARKFKKLTQTQLAEQSGVSQSYICKVERGKMLPDLPATLALEAVLFVRLI